MGSTNIQFIYDDYHKNAAVKEIAKGVSLGEAT